MRIIALDVHRSFAQMAILEKGKIRDAGRIDLERSRLLQFATKLKPDDRFRMTDRSKWRPLNI